MIAGNGRSTAVIIKSYSTYNSNNNSCVGSISNSIPLVLNIRQIIPSIRTNCVLTMPLIGAFNLHKECTIKWITLKRALHADASVRRFQVFEMIVNYEPYSSTEEFTYLIWAQFRVVALYISLLFGDKRRFRMPKQCGCRPIIIDIFYVLMKWFTAAEMKSNWKCEFCMHAAFEDRMSPIVFGETAAAIHSECKHQKPHRSDDANFTVRLSSQNSSRFLWYPWRLPCIIACHFHFECEIPTRISFVIFSFSGYTQLHQPLQHTLLKNLTNLSLDIY